MAKRIGLTATLKFVAGGAVAGMQKASKAFGVLHKSAQQVKMGVNQAKQGLDSIGKVGLGVAAGTGLAVKSFATFEGAFAGVRSILATATQKEFPQLKRQAELLGATTQFTATQSAQAMESLARAGLTPTQTMKAIGPVLNAAAAEGIDLSAAADIASKNMKAFGLTTASIPKIVDTLAFVSKNTNSTMVGLQEGLKLSSSSAKALGISVFATTKALGILNDVGLNNTMAGTALNNAMVKMAKGVKNGVIPITGELSAKLEKTANGSVNLEQTMLNIVVALKQIKDPTKRLNAAMKVFQIRGAKGALAFERLLNDSKLFKKFYGDGTVGGMKKVNKQIEGTAKRMAKIRLDSIAGDSTLFRSAVAGVSINFAKAFGGTMRSALQKFTGVLNQGSKAFQFFAASPQELNKTGTPAIKGVSKEAAGAVKGILLGMRDLKKGFADASKFVMGLGKQFGLFNKSGTTGAARTATKVLGIAAALGVVGIGLRVTTSLFGGMLRVGLGTARMLTGAFRPLGAMLGGIGAAIAKKFPLLGKAGGKIPGVAGKLFKGLDNLTAQPVRVTNVAEFALAAGATSGGAGTAAAAGVGIFSMLRGKFLGLVAAIPLFGAALTAPVAGLFTLKAGLLVAGAKIALVVAALGAIGFAAFRAGEFLEKKFGVGSKLGVAVGGLVNNIRGRFAASASKKKFDKVAGSGAVQNLIRVLQAGRSKSVRFRGETGRRLITRELAQERARKALAKRGVTGAAADAQIKALAPLLARLPTKDQVVLSKKELADEIKRGLQDNLKVNLQIGNKVIATTVGQAKKEGQDRGITPGTRRAAATGAAP